MLFTLASSAFKYSSMNSSFSVCDKRSNQYNIIQLIIVSIYLGDAGE